MKKGIMKKLIAGIVLGCFMLGLIACDNGQKDPNRFDVELKSGFGNSVELGSYAPFYVEITNNGTDFEGAVQMIIPGIDGKNIMYQKDLSIQAGGTKTVELVGKIDKITRQVKIIILNDKEKEIWSSLESCNTLADLKNVKVGILSDDFSALGYMDQKTFSANKELSTQIYELDKDTFPSDWHALDMLDVIVVSDFSTDILSTEQMNALTLWVNNGGLLMVGTGSTANKTLSGLNGKLFDVEVGELFECSTKYGLTLTNYSYDYGMEDSYYSPYDDSLYMTFFEENYEALYETFEMNYMDSFQYDWGFDPYYDTWDEYWEDCFYTYCFDEFYEVYLENIGSANSTNSGLVANMPYADAKILDLDGDILSDNTTIVFQAEDSKGQPFNLAHAIQQGEGYVLLSGVDFTKTPLSNYEGNSMLFIHWVETLIGEKCYEDALNYGNTYSYNNFDYSQEQILMGAVTAKVPPILLYMGILLLYVIAVLVIYLVLRHKKKTVKLWVLYPIIAAGLSLLIFCIGFSTRIYRPIVGAITLITPNGSVSTQQTYAAVTVPNNKVYEIGFSPSQGVEYVNLDYSYYYGDEEINWDSYEIGYKYGYESVDVTLGEQEAMANVFFMLDSVVADKRNVIVESDTGYKGGLQITNDFGCDLEAAVLLVEDDIYIIGDMENGDTVSFSQLTKYDDGSYYSTPSLGSVVYEDEGWKVLLGLIFGSASSAYDEYLCRALNAITRYANRYEGADVVFVAIPTESTATPMQGGTDYNERRTEVIYIEYDLVNYYGGY